MQRKSLCRSLFAAGSFALLLGSALGAHAQNTVVYDNEEDDSDTGYVVTNGGATAASKVTYMIADDINVLAGYGGMGVVSFDFSVANQNAAAVSVSPTLNFYGTDGTSGGPGTLLGTVTLTAFSVPSGGGLYTYAPTSGTIFTIPTNGSFWAGETFTSTATAARLNNIGEFIYDPPTVGTSQDLLFESNSPGLYKSSNPAGAQYTAPFGDGLVGNLAWEFEVAPPAAAPEPSQFAALAIGGLGLGMMALRARKRSVSS